MKRMKVTKVMNLFCIKRQHDKCKGMNKGNSNDMETFICTCSCHTATNFENLAKLSPFYKKEEN